MSNTALLTIARSYVAAGLSVIPIAANETKAPAGWLLPKDENGKATWKPYQERIATDDELVHWFGGRQKVGIGIVTGKVSGNLEVFDIDDSKVGHEWWRLIKEQPDGAELLAQPAMVKTPSSGAHCLYRCPQIQGNQKLAQRLVQNGDKPEVVTLLETRGEGGYIVAVGSPPECHKRGKEGFVYKLVQGDLLKIPEITETDRDLILSHARQLNEYVAPADIVTGDYTKKERTENRTTNGIKPGDAYNERADWKEVLEPHGWVEVIEGKWRKPGKSGKVWQATTDHAGSDLFYCFSTAAYPFEGGKSYSKFAVFALLNHGGDYSLAARELATKGYGTSDATGGKPNMPPTSEPEQPPDYSDSDTFGEPLLFGDIETPEATTDFLPDWVRDYVNAVAAHTQVTAGVVAMLSLAVLAACIQKRFEVSPSGDDYSEILSFWVLVLLPPGSRKTAVMDALLKPIIEWEAEQAKAMAANIDQDQSERSIALKRIAILEQKIAKGDE